MIKVKENIHAIRAQFGCSQEAIGRILGVSTRTIARWEGQESRPSTLANQKLRELEVLLQKIQTVVKKGKEKQWLSTPQSVLNNKTPLETIQTGSEGVNKILKLLGQIEWGIMS